MRRQPRPLDTPFCASDLSETEKSPVCFKGPNVLSSVQSPPCLLTRAQKFCARGFELSGQGKAICCQTTRCRPQQSPASENCAAQTPSLFICRGVHEDAGTV